MGDKLADGVYTISSGGTDTIGGNYCNTNTITRMMMRVCIVGHTKGLGQKLYQYFLQQGHDVVGFNSQDSLDNIIEQSMGCDLFINNAYSDDNIQLTLLHTLKDKVKKLIVCGSIVTDCPDPTDPIYTLNKNRLEEGFMNLAINKIPSRADMLLLKLTSSSFKDFETIKNSIMFWFDNPSVIVLTFNIDEKLQKEIKCQLK